MTRIQLQNLLSQFPEDMEVMILDSFNGGGEPREINLGPLKRIITKENIDNGADCEDKEVGQTIIVLGYGCY